MQYLVICLQGLTEIHGGAFILEMYWLMYHSALPLTAGVQMFVIFNAVIKTLHAAIKQGECVHETHTDFKLFVVVYQHEHWLCSLM